MNSNTHKKMTEQVLELLSGYSEYGDTQNILDKKSILLGSVQDDTQELAVGKGTCGSIDIEIQTTEEYFNFFKKNKTEYHYLGWILRKFQDATSPWLWCDSSTIDKQNQHDKFQKLQDWYADDYWKHFNATGWPGMAAFMLYALKNDKNPPTYAPPGEKRFSWKPPAVNWDIKMLFYRLHVLVENIVKGSDIKNLDYFKRYGIYVASLKFCLLFLVKASGYEGISYGNDPITYMMHPMNKWDMFSTLTKVKNEDLKRKK